MAEPIKRKGKDVFITLNGLAIACSKQCTIELSTKTADTTSKCSTGANGQIWNSALPVSNSWKITDTGFTALDTGASSSNVFSTYRLRQLQINMTKCYAFWKTEDNTYEGGNVWITSVKETASVEDVDTYDIELVGDGEIGNIPVS